MAILDLDLKGINAFAQVLTPISHSRWVGERGGGVGGLIEPFAQTKFQNY